MPYLPYYYVGALALVIFGLFVTEVALRRWAGKRYLTRPLRKFGVVLAFFLAIGILPLTILELILRGWAGRSLWSLKRTKPEFANHRDTGRGSWTVPFETVVQRDNLISRVQWDELKEGLKSYRFTERTRSSLCPHPLFQIEGSYHGTEFSFGNGERSTTDQPDTFESEILCFGGSTTFSMEVSDSRTWPSVLQRLLNNSGSGSRRVRNFGVPGTPGQERLNTLMYASATQPGDIVLFLFGDNDSGWMQYGRRKGMVHTQLPWLLKKILVASEFFEVANWIYGEIAPRYLQRLAIETADETIAAAEKICEMAEASGFKVLFALQPNIFTLANPDDWDTRIIELTARDLSVMIGAAYARYRAWIAGCQFAIDATSLFDSESPSPYLTDWAHTNTRGNQLIGEFVFREIKSRGWLPEIR